MAAEAKSPGDPQTPDQIVSEIEDTREQLAETIDALVDRTSPKNVVRRAGDNVKGQFLNPDGSPRNDQLAKAGAAVLGFIVVVVGLRRLVGGR